MDRRAFTPLRERLVRWLFRVGPPEPAPIVLVQRRVFVLPTLAGLAYGAGLVVMLLAAINYNLSLGYGLVFLLAGVGVASIVHAFRNLLHLSLRPGRIDPVFAGDPARFPLLVANPREARRPALRCKAKDAVQTFELAPGETGEVSLALPTHRRGRFPLGRVVVETTFPLGLIRAWSVVVPQAECLVYPAPEPDVPPLPEGASPTGERGKGRSGNDDFAGFRAHQFADSPRHVAWKVVARGGPLLTKQFSGLDGSQISLDWDALPGHLDVEQRLRRLAAWVLAAEAAGVRFALHLPDGNLAPDSGAPHVQACLRRLALFGLPDERHG